MILRLLNWQGIAGVAVSIALLGLLVAQAIDARHWHKSSDRFEQLYTNGQLALANTTAAYRAATDTARAEDRANSARIAAEQHTINERTEHDFETRLADARATAARLSERLRASPAAADPGSGGTAPVPGLSAAPRSAPQAAGDNRLPDDRLPDSAALIATEQAIQLDELIVWVRKQAAVDPNKAPEPVHP